MAGQRVILRADYDFYEYTAYVYRQPYVQRQKNSCKLKL